MGSWKFAYNTNGLAHHRLREAVLLLSEAGYDAVALTLDVHHLDPYAPQHDAEVAEIAELLAARRMDVIIESGARFNLDYRVKHYPSLLCREDRIRRIDFLLRCIDVAHKLGATCVSFWSGHNFDRLEPDEAFELLVDGIARILPEAEAAGVDLAFEPEPGMFIETLDGYARLKARFPNPRFGLALDVGHLVVTCESSIPDAIRRYRGEILTVSLEDMKLGEHVHLPFGRGDIEFEPIFVALEEIGYRGLLSVELSRDSTTAPETVAESLRFLSRF